MSGFVRCSSGHTGPAWTCVLPAGHDGDHIYSLWSEIATMAEAEIRLHEAAIQRVREVCGNELDEGTGYMRDEWAGGRNFLRDEILDALDGGAE